MRVLRNIVSALCAAFLAGCNLTTGLFPESASPPEPMLTYAQDELRDLTPAEKQVLSKSLAKGMKDPASARFTWLKFPKNAVDSVTYCSMVNAKNSNGGYTGSMPFMAVITVKNGKAVGAALSQTGSDDSSSKSVREQCQKKGFDPYLAA
jgi:hypothetical protein